MRERHGRVLAELAEVGMAMVRRLSEAMLRTQDVRTEAQIGLAFHRVSRAVRQTLALEFRLAEAARREALAPSPTPRPTATPPAPYQPRISPERVGWNEYERPDSDEALDALDELLEAEDLDVDAVHEAVDASMARLRQDIAADALLVKAGVLAPDDPESALTYADRPPTTPQRRNRRSELFGAASFPRLPPTTGPSIWRSSA
ncbi:MAG: hypothetical protein Q8M88_11645 [Phenylobacterium sp.]|uniref:hypothetical protein n=1 Tax=Phenylobacterium sp. TaxID=1871053 RepID=UPI0027375157|nr:hypothetical protein [Phenylobacterium sp.]MDP3175075.1 hypothetical protein [Phenylobacterium sp.]